MPEQPFTRKAELADPELYSQYQNCNRWALIVGISKYQYQGWNLQYAHRDAEEFYKLLLTPNGGSFEEKHICKLTNEQATTDKITQALRSFLQKPAHDDLVVLYFACHGSPDPNRPDNLYLLTHNTDPGDIPGTALPMREVKQAVTENLYAQRALILADTCHSGGISGGGRRTAADDSTLMNQYLKELSRATKGVATFTSAEPRQVAQEGAKWGGGHGVFTHYLLEGMRGAADRDRNGIITVGELFEYVRDCVKRDTDDRQHPLISSDGFDRLLPIAIVPNSNLPKTLKTNQYQHQDAQDFLQDKVSVLADDLSSACGADYKALQNLLSMKDWQKADEEVNIIIEKILSKNIIGIRGIPCQDLWTIDQLWMKYSNECFGFSKQYQIWRYLEGENNRLKKFFVKAGWMTESKRELTVFSLGTQYLEVDATKMFDKVKKISIDRCDIVLPSLAKFITSKHSSEFEKNKQVTCFFSRLSECNFDE